MAGSVKRVPEGYHTVSPHLTVRGGAQAIEFYKNICTRSAGGAGREREDRLCPSSQGQPAG